MSDRDEANAAEFERLADLAEGDIDPDTLRMRLTTTDADRDTSGVEERARLERVMRYGASKAKATGVKPGDANEIIHRGRRESVAADLHEIASFFGLDPTGEQMGRLIHNDPATIATALAGQRREVEAARSPAGRGRLRP